MCNIAKITFSYLCRLRCLDLKEEQASLEEELVETEERHQAFESEQEHCPSRDALTQQFTTWTHLHSRSTRARHDTPAWRMVVNGPGRKCRELQLEFVAMVT